MAAWQYALNMTLSMAWFGMVLAGVVVGGGWFDLPTTAPTSPLSLLWCSVLASVVSLW